MVNLKHPQLSGLGRNAAAPQDVRVRLAAHRAGRHGISQFRGRLEDEVVEALLRHGGGDSAVGLHGDRISPRMRKRIAEHSDPVIRDAFADFVRKTVERKVPLGIEDLEEAYGRPRTELVRAPGPALRAAVARAWHERSPAVQVELLTDPDPRVRAAATEHEQPGIPPEWRERCLADPAVRASAARRVPLTPEQFARLIQDEDEETRRAAAENPHLSAEMVALLLDSEDPSIRMAAAHSRHVDPGTRDRLYALVEAQRADGDLAAAVALDWGLSEPAWLRGLPLAERLTYLDCRHSAFRRVLASCRDLPEEAWRRLDEDPEIVVRHAAAQRPDAPSALLETLARECGDVNRLRPPLVGHPNFPRHRLRTFVGEPDPLVRGLALHDPELPAPDLGRLASAAESFLRVGVARHPNITDALLDRLLCDPDPRVADEAAANPALGPERMYRILDAAGL